MGVRWTKEQQQVIDLRNRNLLVSAAAGSGKTAVLVERIIGRLTRDANPLDVDQLLVVTYTEAAAAEMRERIGRAIETALIEDPGNQHLKRQSVLIHTAKITTIHSFCLSVIREYFHTIDLDPGFRIGEEGELKLLRQDVLREMLEDYYTQADEKFLRFVETFATGKDDKKLGEMILRLYEFAGAYPDPEAWLNDSVDAYRDGNQTFLGFVRLWTEEVLSDVSGQIQTAREICGLDQGLQPYLKTLDSDEKLVLHMRAVPYEKKYEAMGEKGALPFVRLAAVKKGTADEGLINRVKTMRDDWKKQVDELRELFYFCPPEKMEEDIRQCVPVVEMLAELVIEFGNRFAEKKTERNVIDFRDMEQFALKILTKKENGHFVPGDVAREYQDQFEEVMIDEYQDSNLIQEAILTSVSRISRGEPNLFMVGDVKQSIYRFRLSRPELFMEKYRSYTVGEGPDQRIDLHKNFRSRREVLDCTNKIFRQIMTELVGGIRYDDDAALYVGADYPETKGNETEILILEKEAGDKKIAKEEAREWEARMTAGRIHELIEAGKVWDAAKGAYRPVRYSDIVILTRSLQGWSDLFMQVLNQEGIPAFASSKEGYFQTLEIGWIMDYLRVLDNYRQDIPMTAVLRSPFGGLTNEELAQIKNARPEDRFSEAVLNIMRCEEVEKSGVPARTWGKLRVIFANLETFRRRVPYMAIHDLLSQILTETGYKDYVAAMPGGEQRLANLDMLLVRAKAFESTSYKGLYHFVRYVGQLQKYDVDYGEAGIYAETTNAVRIMSIHKSKGLEFPIVFVCGMGKRFNTQDVKAEVVLHPEFGMGMDVVDPEERTKSPTLYKKLMKFLTHMENLGEELRVLYVAMTRAKEKLILTGTVSDMEKEMQEGLVYKGELDADEPLSFHLIRRATSYLDWILPAAVRCEGLAPMEIKAVTPEEIVADEIIRERMDLLEKKAYLKTVQAEESPMAETDEAFRKRLEDQLSYIYPYEGEEQRKLKYTVSELKKRPALEEESGETLIEEEEIIPLLPAFLQEEDGLKGASRGSAYHRVLELLDFTKDHEKESLSQDIARLVENGTISREMADCVRETDLLKFLRSESGKRMQAAAKKGLLYREQPFVFGVQAKEIYPESDSEELVLIQGIIDVYFEEDGELVVLDYKTDRVQKGQELVEKYAEQLHLYGKALEQMTEKKVKEKLIYSFALKEEILCR